MARTGCPPAPGAALTGGFSMLAPAAAAPPPAPGYSAPAGAPPPPGGGVGLLGGAANMRSLTLPAMLAPPPPPPRPPPPPAATPPGAKADIGCEGRGTYVLACGTSGPAHAASAGPSAHGWACAEGARGRAGRRRL